MNKHLESSVVTSFEVLLGEFSLALPDRLRLALLVSLVANEVENALRNHVTLEVASVRLDP